MSMTTLLEILTALVGTVVPLAALAAFSWWRLARTATRRQQRLSLPNVVEPEETSHDGLAWIRETIGRQPPAPMPPQQPRLRCTRCGFEVVEAAFFCRRCGTRLGPPRAH
jgi:hypothetical protein